MRDIQMELSIMNVYSMNATKITGRPHENGACEGEGWLSGNMPRKLRTGLGSSRGKEDAEL